MVDERVSRLEISGSILACGAITSHLDLTIYAVLRENSSMDEIWMDDEDVRTVQELRAEGRHVTVELRGLGVLMLCARN